MGLMKEAVLIIRTCPCLTGMSQRLQDPRTCLVSRMYVRLCACIFHASLSHVTSVCSCTQGTDPNADPNDLCKTITTRFISCNCKKCREGMTAQCPSALEFGDWTNTSIRKKSAPVPRVTRHGHGPKCQKCKKAGALHTHRHTYTHTHTHTQTHTHTLYEHCCCTAALLQSPADWPAGPRINSSILVIISRTLSEKITRRRISR